MVVARQTSQGAFRDPRIRSVLPTVAEHGEVDDLGLLVLDVGPLDE